MRALSVILALATAGCATRFVSEQEHKAMTARLDKLEAKFTNEYTMALHLYDELVSKHGQNQKKLADMEILLKGMETTLRKLEDDMKTALAAAKTQQHEVVKNGTTAPPPPDPRKSIEEILLDIETTLSQLRAGKITPGEATVQFKPYAGHAASRVLEEMERSITDFEYSNTLEAILSTMPPAELKGPLTRGLTRGATRESAARIVGNTGDPELGKILLPHASSKDEDFKLAIGEGLVRCKHARGLPILIDCLRSTQSSTRVIAIDALRKVNNGKDFGYRAPLPPAQNAGAIKSWDEWHLKFGAKIFE